MQGGIANVHSESNSNFRPESFSQARYKKSMATIQKELITKATPEQVWSALRDVGALHTRLAPGFVVDTRMEPDARLVTFANGMVVRERIVTVDDALRRFVWRATGETLSHHNGAAQVFPYGDGGSKLIWTTDLLPDEAAAAIGPVMGPGIAPMPVALTKLAADH